MITTSEAARRLGINRQWVWRLVQAGRLPAVKQGRDWLIDDRDLGRLERRPRGRPARQD